jgi:hypothetical protein
MNITTKYQTNASGTGQILAKGAGKQRTVAYNQERTPDWNHGNAAGVLANALGLTRADARDAEHTVEADGRHRFVS